MKKYILVFLLLFIPISVSAKDYKEIVISKKDIKSFRLTNKPKEINSFIENNKLLKISLNSISNYDIYYRTYTTKYGWNDWAKNGEIAGVNNYKIDKLEVMILEKFDPKSITLKNNKPYIKYPKYIPVYYSQKDRRWKDEEYGDYAMGGTGCAPTAMAMAFSGILDKQVLPTDVADYLYDKTKEFNYKTSGTSGKGIKLASKHFGIKITPLKSKKEIKKALKRGKIIYTSMGKGTTFGTKKYNHAIIFYGYKNGYTKVFDPLKKKNNKKVTIKKLWKEQSKDYDDHNGITNFYSLER